MRGTSVGRGGRGRCGPRVRDSHQPHAWSAPMGCGEVVSEGLMRTRPAATVAVGAALALLAATPAFAAVGTTPAPSSTATGPVLNSVQAGSRLYIGGSFTRVDNTAMAGLAALDAATGVRDPGFKADVQGKVYALATDGTTIYIGGSFTSVAAWPGPTSRPSPPRGRSSAAST